MNYSDYEKRLSVISERYKKQEAPAEDNQDTKAVSAPAEDNPKGQTIFPDSELFPKEKQASKDTTQTENSPFEQIMADDAKEEPKGQTMFPNGELFPKEKQADAKPWEFPLAVGKTAVASVGNALNSTAEALVLAKLKGWQTDLKGLANLTDSDVLRGAAAKIEEGKNKLHQSFIENRQSLNKYGSDAFNDVIGGKVRYNPATKEWDFVRNDEGAWAKFSSLSEGAANMAGFMTTASIPLLGTPLVAAQSAMETYDERISDKDLSELQKCGGALVTGTLMGVLTKTTPIKYFEPMLKGMVGKYGEKRVVDTLTKIAQKKAYQIVSPMMKESVAAMDFMVSDKIGTNIINKEIYGDTKDERGNDLHWYSGVDDAAVEGLEFGAFMHGAKRAAQAVGDRVKGENLPAQKEAVENALRKSEADKRDFANKFIEANRNKLNQGEDGKYYFIVDPQGNCYKRTGNNEFTSDLGVIVNGKNLRKVSFERILDTVYDVSHKLKDMQEVSADDTVYNPVDMSMSTPKPFTPYAQYEEVKVGDKTIRNSYIVIYDNSMNRIARQKVKEEDITPAQNPAVEAKAEEANSAETKQTETKPVEGNVPQAKESEPHQSGVSVPDEIWEKWAKGELDGDRDSGIEMLVKGGLATPSETIAELRRKTKEGGAQTQQTESKPAEGQNPVEAKTEETKPTETASGVEEVKPTDKGGESNVDAELDEEMKKRGDGHQALLDKQSRETQEEKQAIFDDLKGKIDRIKSEGLTDENFAMALETFEKYHDRTYGKGTFGLDRQISNSKKTLLHALWEKWAKGELDGEQEQAFETLVSKYNEKPSTSESARRKETLESRAEDRAEEDRKNERLAEQAAYEEECANAYDDLVSDGDRLLGDDYKLQMFIDRYEADTNERVKGYVDKVRAEIERRKENDKGEQTDGEGNETEDKRESEEGDKGGDTDAQTPDDLFEDSLSTLSKAVAKSSEPNTIVEWFDEYRKYTDEHAKYIKSNRKTLTDEQIKDLELNADEWKGVAKTFKKKLNDSLRENLTSALNDRKMTEEGLKDALKEYEVAFEHDSTLLTKGTKNAYELLHLRSVNFGNESAETRKGKADKAVRDAREREEREMLSAFDNILQGDGEITSAEEYYECKKLLAKSKKSIVTEKGKETRQRIEELAKKFEDGQKAEPEAVAFKKLEDKILENKKENKSYEEELETLVKDYADTDNLYVKGQLSEYWLTPQGGGLKYMKPHYETVLTPQQIDLLRGEAPLDRCKMIAEIGLSKFDLASPEEKEFVAESKTDLKKSLCDVITSFKPDELEGKSENNANSDMLKETREKMQALKDLGEETFVKEQLEMCKKYHAKSERVNKCKGLLASLLGNPSDTISAEEFKKIKNSKMNSTDAYYIYRTLNDAKRAGKKYVEDAKGQKYEIDSYISAARKRLGDDAVFIGSSDRYFGSKFMGKLGIIAKEIGFEPESFKSKLRSAFEKIGIDESSEDADRWGAASVALGDMRRNIISDAINANLKMGKGKRTYEYGGKDIVVSQETKNRLDAIDRYIKSADEIGGKGYESARESLKGTALEESIEEEKARDKAFHEHIDPMIERARKLGIAKSISILSDKEIKEKYESLGGDLGKLRNGGRLKGFVNEEGEVFLNRDFMTLDTPMHEISHLIINAMMKHGKISEETLASARMSAKRSGLFGDKEITDKEIGEVLATMIGRRCAKIEETNKFARNLSDLAIRVWNWVKVLFGNKDAQDDATLRDFTNEVADNMMNGETRTALIKEIETLLGEMDEIETQIGITANGYGTTDSGAIDVWSFEHDLMGAGKGKYFGVGDAENQTVRDAYNFTFVDRFAPIQDLLRRVTDQAGQKAVDIVKTMGDNYDKTGVTDPLTASNVYNDRAKREYDKMYDFEFVQSTANKERLYGKFMKAVQTLMYGTNTNNTPSVAGQPMEIVGEYMYARHALVRNATLPRKVAEDLVKRLGLPQTSPLASRLNQGNLTQLTKKEFRDLYRKSVGKEPTPSAMDAYERMIREDLSGMTNAEASRIVTAFETGKNKMDIDMLWLTWSEMTDYDLKLALRHGLVNQEYYDAHAKNLAGVSAVNNRTYDYYVPLRGWADAEEYSHAHPELNYYSSNLGRGGNAFTHSAEGRKTKAVNPIHTFLTNSMVNCNRGNRNEIARSLGRFVERMNKLAETDATCDISDKVEICELKRIDKKTNVEENCPADEFGADESRYDYKFHAPSSKTDFPYDATKQNEHLVHYWDNGKRMTIAFHKEWKHVADCINLVGEFSQKNPVSNRYAQKLYSLVNATTNFARQVQTTYSATFLLKNSTPYVGKDAQTYAIILGGKKNAAKNYRKALSTVGKVFLAGKEDLSDKDVREFAKFLDLGGMTGMIYNGNLNDKSKRVMQSEQEVMDAFVRSETDAKSFGDKMRKVSEVATRQGSMLEAYTRFASYLTAKDNGATDMEAVKLAKEICGNFSRRGTGMNSKMLSWWYANKPFVNAAFQGAYGSLRTFKSDKIYDASNGLKGLMLAVGEQVTRKTIAFAMIGFLNEEFNRALSDEDGSGRDRYENVSQYLRANSLGMYIGDNYYYISSPVFFRGLMGLGAQMSMYWHGEKDLFSAERDGIMGLTTDLSPMDYGAAVDALTGEENGEKALLYSIVGMVSPVLGPVLTGLATNNTFSGSKIYDDSIYNEHKPEYLRVRYGTVNNQLLAMSKALAELGGATDELKPGMVDEYGSLRMNQSTIGRLLDWNPAKVQFVLEQALPITRELDLFCRESEGEYFNLGHKPLLHVFATTTPQARDKRQKLYYDGKELLTNIKKREKAGEKISISDWLFKDLGEGIVRDVEKQKKRVKQLKAMYVDAKDEFTDEQIDAVRQKIEMESCIIDALYGDLALLARAHETATNGGSGEYEKLFRKLQARHSKTGDKFVDEYNEIVKAGENGDFDKVSELKPSFLELWSGWQQRNLDEFAERVARAKNGEVSHNVEY